MARPSICQHIFSALLLATLLIGTVTGEKIGDVFKVTNFFQTISRQTSSSIIDDLRACNFCFASEKRYQCSLMVKAIHRATPGHRLSEAVVAQRVLTLFTGIENGKEAFECMTAKVANPSNAPSPYPHSVTTDFTTERSPEYNADILSKALIRHVFLIFKNQADDRSRKFSLVAVYNPIAKNKTSSPPAVGRNSYYNGRDALSNKQAEKYLGMKYLSRDAVVADECQDFKCGAKVFLEFSKSLNTDKVKYALRDIKNYHQNFTEIFTLRNHAISSHDGNKFYITLRFRRRYLKKVIHN